MGKPNKSKKKQIEKKGALVPFISSVWFVIAAVATLLTFTWFFPRVSVTQATTLNADNPLLTPFVISNNGNTNIDIEYSFGIRNITTVVGMKWNGAPDFTSTLSGPPERIKLKVGEPTTVIFPPPPAIRLDMISKADIAVVVIYKIPFIPIKFKRPFRFITVADVAGKLNWYPKAVDTGLIPDEAKKA